VCEGLFATLNRDYDKALRFEKQLHRIAERKIIINQKNMVSHQSTPPFLAESLINNNAIEYIRFGAAWMA
jgi:hypothetical protein